MARVLTPELRGLQVFPLRFDSSVLGSLAAATGVFLNTSLVAWPISFLAQQVRYVGRINSLAAQDGVLLMVVPGGSTVAEVEEALETIDADPTDPSNYGRASITKRVVWNSLFNLPQEGGGIDVGGADKSSSFDSDWMKLGIPFSEGRGPGIFAYNYTDTNLDAAAQVTMFAFFRGVILGD